MKYFVPYITQIGLLYLTAYLSFLIRYLRKGFEVHHFLNLKGWQNLKKEIKYTVKKIEEKQNPKLLRFNTVLFFFWIILPLISFGATIAKPSSTTTFFPIISVFLCFFALYRIFDDIYAKQIGIKFNIIKPGYTNLTVNILLILIRDLGAAFIYFYFSY